ncbi:pre-rRNA processing [Thecaphora frezii]
MDPFASYAHIATPHQFWAELDELLDPSSSAIDSSSEDEKRRIATALLQSFLSLCEHGFDADLCSQYNLDYAIRRLLGSELLRRDDSAVARSGSVSVAHYLAEEACRVVQTATSIPIILLTYEIVLQYGQDHPDTYKALQASASSVSYSGIRAFLHRLVHQIWAGSYAAQAEAKIGPSYQDLTSSWQASHPDDTDGANDDNDDDDDDDVGYYRRQQQPRRFSIDLSLATVASSSSSASKQLAKQISLRDKAVQMLYEVCRVQKLEPSHLKAFDERFIQHLFDLVEETRHYDDERFNYQLIKLIASINEQYMVSGIAAAASNKPDGLAANTAGMATVADAEARPVNLVLDVLKLRLNASKTFGENLIFMLNRASSSNKEDLCMQLLVLKLLYLLFTTKETACYFYTNDLKVLVDIFIRELSDLPDESESLRHTYLRVLHPLLTNTQLCTYPYKRPQIRRLLIGLVSHGHLREIGATTRRLVERCLRAEWCVELDKLDGTSSIATVAPIGGGQMHSKKMQPGITTEGVPMLSAKIETSSTNDMTTAKVAQARDESEPQISIGGAELQSPISPTDTEALSRDSGPSLLAVPRHVASRNKRVHSMSHARSSTDASASDGSPSGHAPFYRRFMSAKSAPPTPPRLDSPDIAVDDDDGSEAMSTASSWHAHMADVHDKGRGGLPSSSTLLTSGEPTPGATHFPKSHSSIEALGHPPRIASPLSLEATSAILFMGLDHGLEGDIDLSQRVGHPDGRSAIGKGLPSLHVRTASNGEREDSDMTITGEHALVGEVGRHAESRGSSMELSDGSVGRGGLALATGKGGTGPPPQRRRPPEPPSHPGSLDRHARRVLHVSSSDPGTLIERNVSATISGTGAPDYESSLPSLPHQATAAAATGVHRTASPQPQPRAWLESAVMSATTSASSSTGRRRPPPPPPDRAAKPGAGGRSVTSVSSRTSTPDNASGRYGAGEEGWPAQRGSQHLRVATEPQLSRSTRTRESEQPSDYLASELATAARIA